MNMNFNSELENAIIDRLTNAIINRLTEDPQIRDYLTSMANAKPNNQAEETSPTIYVGCTVANVCNSGTFHYHPIAIDAAFLGEGHENKLLFSENILEIQNMVESVRMMQDDDVVILDFNPEDFEKLNKNYSITVNKISSAIDNAVNALAPIDNLIDRSALTSIILMGIAEKTDGIIGTGFTSEREEINGDDFDYTTSSEESEISEVDENDVVKAAAEMSDEEKEAFIKEISYEIESYIGPSDFEIALYNYLIDHFMA